MKNQHWSEINEATSVRGIKFLFAVYRGLGRGVFNVLLVPVIVYFFCFQGRARRASLGYLQRVRAQGGLSGQASLRLLNIRHFFHFGSGLLDKLAAWSGGIGLGDVQYKRYREFLDVVQSGQGCVVVASHLGNMEVSRMLANTHKRVKLNILVHTKHAENFNRVLREVDESSCMNLIQVSEVTPATAVMLNAKVQAGEVVVIAGDRTPIGGGQRQSEVDFLGDLALMPQGPYILASILHCPVFLIFCLRDDSGYQVIIEPFADRIHLTRKNRDAELGKWTQRFADRLAHYTLQYPLQWFNFYDFWSRPDSQSASQPTLQEEASAEQPASQVRKA